MRGKMKIKNNLVIILVIALLFQIKAFGHGEDKPGPNGGYIRMPGAFHTELVQINDQKFKVYLLDINWKNPTTKDSSIEALIKFKAESISASCKTESTVFVCDVPKGKSLKSAKEISLKAKRQNAVGAAVSYELPLRFFSH